MSSKSPPLFLLGLCALLAVLVVPDAVLSAKIPVAKAKVEVSAASDDWSTFSGEKYYFKVFTQELTQPKALDFCHNLGGNLASIHSDAENKFVQGLLDKVDSAQKNRYWIGLKLLHNQGNDKLISTVWTDGTAMDYGKVDTIGAGKYPWATYPAGSGHASEPNSYNGPEACVNFGHHVQFPQVGWVDQLCNEMKGFVCKK